MELKDFVSTALADIIEGVIAAQERVQGTGAKINPRLSRMIPKGEKNYEVFALAEVNPGNPVFLVKFDVAVTASKGTRSKGGVGVVTGIVSLGSTGASENAESAVSRISFALPLLVPSHPDARERSPSP